MSLINSLPETVFTTKVDELLNWGRASSQWYMLFGLACCAIELMQTGGPRADVDRFGAVPRATPRQSDLMIVAGTLTYKMAKRTKLLYDQMPVTAVTLNMSSRHRNRRPRIQQREMSTQQKSCRTCNWRAWEWRSMSAMCRCLLGLL